MKKVLALALSLIFVAAPTLTTSIAWGVFHIFGPAAYDTMDLKNEVII